MSFKPLAQFQSAGKIRAVLTDIDDTLTEAGRLPAITYQAMENLKAAGFLVIPVTGRPAGWCDLIARQWPVDGVVGENGAFYFRCNGAMIRRYMKSAAERTQDRQKLELIKAEVLAKIPGSAVASDQAYREADLAIDFCEDVPPLAPEAVTRIVDIFEAHGATAKISSIHVNGWFGGYDKLTTSLRMLADEFAIPAETARQTIIFAGDSPNDAPMFGYFENSVGVANVAHFKHPLQSPPKWITRAPTAQGFAELAELLCGKAA